MEKRHRASIQRGLSQSGAIRSKSSLVPRCGPRFNEGSRKAELSTSLPAEAAQAGTPCPYAQISHVQTSKFFFHPF